jgi:hypothetical protein
LEDPSGRACLLVLPSDRPSTRAEAAAVEALLCEVLRDPQAAARRACEWRAGALSGACSGSLAALLAAMKGDGGSGGGQGGMGRWRFKEVGGMSLTGALARPRGRAAVPARTDDNALMRAAAPGAPPSGLSQMAATRLASFSP